jgi:hypothetical protein
MASPERIYHVSVRALAFVFVAIGAAMLAVTLLSCGGPLSLGVILGVAFVAVGAGRLWVANRMAR